MSYQVEYRDKEISRLNELLQGGRPLDAVIADSKRGSTDRVVAHLNIQVSDCMHMLLSDDKFYDLYVIQR